MIIHNFKQGTPEWHQHRATHFNASDAPAMMGCSPYKTRSQLLHEKHTGIAPEVDEQTQMRFDAGHRFEALARPLAEYFIGEALYPVTGSDRELSASFDGLTMAEEIIFEHKTLNNELRSIMSGGCTGADLPFHYRAQMEQQLMVSGAEKVLFMASNWNGETLVEEHHCWYESDPELRAHIIAGWNQFEKDLAAYVPPEPVQSAPMVKPIETLPALLIQVTGAVTASNLDEYKLQAMAVIDAVNEDLQTDEDFEMAKKAVKWCEDVEGGLKAAKEHALSQTASIDKLFKAIDDVANLARTKRLHLNNLVTRRNSERKEEIVRDGKQAYQDHVSNLKATETQGLWMNLPQPDFAAATKGMRLFANMKDAVDTLLANSKVAANAAAQRIRSNLALIGEQSEYKFLFNDYAELVIKEADHLALIIGQRIGAHKAEVAAKEEAYRAQIQAEEQAKAEAAARAKIEAEQAAAKAEEAHAQAEADAQRVELEPPLQPPLQPKEPEDAVISTPPRRLMSFAKSPAADEPKINLGEINKQLAPLSLTADGLAQLGFAHVGTDKSAKLYHESDFPRICEAIIKHVESKCGVEA